MHSGSRPRQACRAVQIEYLRSTGQAILSFRALAQSERFDGAWKLVSAEYRRDVSFPENVVPKTACRVSSV
jgi:hypothetical protein